MTPPPPSPRLPRPRGTPGRAAERRPWARRAGGRPRRAVRPRPPAPALALRPLARPEGRTRSERARGGAAWCPVHLDFPRGPAPPLPPSRTFHRRLTARGGPFSPHSGFASPAPRPLRPFSAFPPFLHVVFYLCATLEFGAVAKLFSRFLAVSGGKNTGGLGGCSFPGGFGVETSQDRGPLGRRFTRTLRPCVCLTLINSWCENEDAERALAGGDEQLMRLINSRE